MLLALLLLACDPAPGHDTDAYSACVHWTAIACECGNISSDPTNPEYYCNEDNVTQACADYDPAVCDSQDDAFDSDACEAYHEIDEDHVLGFFNCANEAYADTCETGYDCGPVR